MKTLRRFQYILFFAAVLAFCSYKVKNQFVTNEMRHAEIRDSFIHLCAGHRNEEAQRLYLKLIEGLEKQSTASLDEDQKCSALFVGDDAAFSTDDLVWRYHTSVTKELEKRLKQSVALNQRRK